MNGFLRTVLLALLLIGTGYFAIHWIGTAFGEDFFYRPNWIRPNSEEPLTVICGVLSAFIGLWERILDFWPKGKALKIHIVRAECKEARPWLQGMGKYDVNISLWFDNSEEKDLAIKNMNLYLDNSQEIRFSAYMYEVLGNTLMDSRPSLIAIIPSRGTINMEYTYHTWPSELDLPNEIKKHNLIIEFIFADGKILKKRFHLIE